MKQFENKSVVLFDGVCILCNSSVNFIIKHDTKERFLFASLQSDAAKELLLHFEIKKIDLNTVFLIENGILYKKSTAALKIIKHLSKGFSLLYGFIIIPKSIRNWIYCVIAKNRYKWFGKESVCIIPSEKTRNKFLD